MRGFGAGASHFDRRGTAGEAHSVRVRWRADWGGGVGGERDEEIRLRVKEDFRKRRKG